MFKMKGVIPPMIVPFKENGEVDYDALKELTIFLSGKVDGLFITGSYGSAPLLTLEERERIYSVVIETVQGKIPVIAHVGTADGMTAARLARRAKELGAAAVSAVGPYYYTHDDDAIANYYAQILDAVDGYPVYVYNNPKFQGYPMSLKLLAKLKSMGISGLKDATFDILLLAKYMRCLADENFDVALGTESMWLSAAALGCKAFIPGLGNAFPEICEKMYNEVIAGDYDACRQTQFKVNELRDIMYLARSTQLAIYAMLEIRGVIRAYPRSPFVPATQEEKERIRKRLQELNLISCG